MAAASLTQNYASIASCAPTFKAINSKDIGWKYNHLKDFDNKKKETYDFCNITSSEGISRAKRHQLGIQDDVALRLKTHEDVKVMLRAAMVEKERIKKGIQEVLMQLDTDDTIDIEEICRIRTRKRLAESETSSMVVMRTKGPLANIRAFKLMLEVVGSYGPHLKQTSSLELRVPLLQNELEYTKGLLKNQEVQRNKYVCSIMSDDWTDIKGRTLINFLVNCPTGTMFVKSVDASNYAKTGVKLAKLLDTFIEEMGEKNVFQLVTDNGSNYVAAGK
ncbi:uncharacterized protein LOC131640050 [Vicia villosa]|uniref:uncharacterized protein LOC131640050 n=1 Tax=Vicia villosa TaxID=3911 RepID=UPI00273BADDC|nr:uncharacterized protein LOC131640050 [Vicia villosa]